jgi:hypothetical protein
MKVKGKEKEERTSVVKTVKVLTRPSSQGVNKKDHYFILTEIWDNN